MKRPAATTIPLAVALVSAAAIAARIGLDHHRRAQFLRDDAGELVHCYTPFDVHTCTVGEVEDALRADIDGCAQHEQWHCFALAGRYRYGKGVSRSEAEAKRLYAQACAADYSPACSPYPPFNGPADAGSD